MRASISQRDPDEWTSFDFIALCIQRARSVFLVLELLVATASVGRKRAVASERISECKTRKLRLNLCALRLSLSLLSSCKRFLHQLRLVVSHCVCLSRSTLRLHRSADCATFSASTHTHQQSTQTGRYLLSRCACSIPLGEGK